MKAVSTVLQYCWGAGILLRDRILLRKTRLNPSCRRSFAHPIPQSRRRASRDLFSGSLDYAWVP